MTASPLATLLRPFTDFFLPPTCLSCGAPYPDDALSLCMTCRSAMVRVSEGHPAVLNVRERFCSSGMLDRVVVLYLFEKEGAVQAVIHALKYGGMTAVGVQLGRSIGGLLQTTPDMGRLDAVIPLPLHRSKRRERGYNQSDYIARGIAEVMSIPTLPLAVRRSRYTASQTGLSADERRQNVHGAFNIGNVARDMLDGKRLLLVDDVITTGATMSACAEVLLKHGARCCIGAAIAIAS